MTDISEESRKKAEARLERERDGAKAMAEHLAEAAAVRSKTDRLKALRLAKEASDAAAPPPVKKSRKKVAAS